jgi:hypothetical protein
MRSDIVHRWYATSPHGATTGTGVERGRGAHSVDGTSWRHAYWLSRDIASWEYESGGTVRFPAVSARALREVLGCRLSFRDASRPGPSLDTTGLDGTAVDARLHDGTTSYWWDGAAWTAVAADEWNEPADVEANASAWDPSLAIGVELRLRTTDPNHTPVVYGGQQVWRLEMGARSGAHRRPDSWEDDALIRTVLPWLRGLTYHRGHEVAVASGETAVSLLELAARGYDAASVSGAYWLDTDPDMRSPVAGVLAGGVFTLAEPRDQAARLHLDLACRVNALHLAEMDFVQAKIPVVLLADITADSQGSPSIWTVPVGDTGLQVRAPDRCSAVLTLRIDARDAKDARAVEEAIAQDLGYGSAKELISEGTAQVVRAFVSPASMRERPAQGGALLQRAGEMRVFFERWRGAAVTVPLLQEVVLAGDVPATQVDFVVRAPARVPAQ